MQDVQSGIYDASAEGVIVGCAPRRGSDEKAVAAESLDETAADGDIQMNRVGGAALYDHLVEPDVLSRSILCPDGNLDGGKLLDRVLSLTVVEDEVVQHIRHDLLKKAQMAGVDADDRHRGEVEAVDRFQKCSVAADADQKVRIGAVRGQKRESRTVQLLLQPFFRLFRHFAAVGVDENFLIHKF